jgi:hypothetical protein
MTDLQHYQIEPQILDLMDALGWSLDDDIRVEVGGMAVTGTATHPDANPKWAKPFGTVSYQKDAFIVLKNRSRDPVVPSVPPEEVSQGFHQRQESAVNYEQSSK